MPCSICKDIGHNKKTHHQYVTNGQGTLYNPIYKSKRKIYEGNLKDGERNGHGIEYYSDGQKWYEGEWVNDNKNGHGIFYDCDGSKWEGKWKNDKKNGYGIGYNYDGSKYYEGEWENDKKNGHGIGYNYDGSKRYEGKWVNDKKNGHGTLYYSDGQKWYEHYEGKWNDGQRHGYGIGYNFDGSKCYEGEWQGGKRHGQGTSYNLNGSKHYEGDWKECKFKCRKCWKTIKYKTINDVEHECIEQEKECSICLEVINFGTEITTPCNHIFHRECLSQNFNNSSNCPLCRTDVSVLRSELEPAEVKEKRTLLINAQIMTNTRLNRPNQLQARINNINQHFYRDPEEIERHIQQIRQWW